MSYACCRLLEAGALDVYTLPGTMKKGRPGHVLTVLCRPKGKTRKMVRKIFRRRRATNGAAGPPVREIFSERREMERGFIRPGARCRIKTAAGYGVTHKKPEYEDVAKIAERADILPWGDRYRDEVIQAGRHIDGQEEK